MNLSEAVNTYGIALHEIERRGYKIISDYNEKDDITTWVAKKSLISIYSSCPLTLLGLVTIADYYGENWNKIDGTNGKYFTY